MNTAVPMPPNQPFPWRASYKNQLSASIVNQQLYDGNGKPFVQPAILPGPAPLVALYQLTAYVFLTRGCGGAIPPLVGPLSITWDDGLGPKTISMGVLPTSPLNGDDTRCSAMNKDAPGDIAAMFGGQCQFALGAGKTVTFSCPFKCMASVMGQYAIVLVMNQL